MRKLKSTKVNTFEECEDITSRISITLSERFSHGRFRWNPLVSSGDSSGFSSTGCLKTELVSTHNIVWYLKQRRVAIYLEASTNKDDKACLKFKWMF